jgi:glyoxylase-like metal-dependent hydrolase (beta-lactamase superfamily II)
LPFALCAERTVKGIAEVAPNVFQLEMPLPFPRLPIVNLYLMRDGDELSLVDCGMDIAGALDTFEDYLRHLGVTFKNIRQIIVTHSHPDHIGLSGRMREASGANLIMHRDEAALVPSRYVEVDRILADLRVFLARYHTTFARTSRCTGRTPRFEMASAWPLATRAWI